MAADADIDQYEGLLNHCRIDEKKLHCNHCGTSYTRKGFYLTFFIKHLTGKSKDPRSRCPILETRPDIQIAALRIWKIANRAKIIPQEDDAPKTQEWNENTIAEWDIETADDAPKTQEWNKNTIAEWEIETADDAPKDIGDISVLRKYVSKEDVDDLMIMTLDPRLENEDPNHDDRVRTIPEGTWDRDNLLKFLKSFINPSNIAELIPVDPSTRASALEREKSIPCHKSHHEALNKE